MLNVLKWVLVVIGAWVVIAFSIAGIWVLLKERGFRR